MGFVQRLQHAWNAFLGRDPTQYEPMEYGSSYRPDRARYSRGNERSIISAIYTRIAIDVAAIKVEHAHLDDDERFDYQINSGLNKCLTLSANLDQTGRAFMQDVVESLLDEGDIALVPVDTTLDPKLGSFDIKTIRVGKVKEWFPSHVRVEVYNEKDGKKYEVLLPKATVALVQNPMYAVMNEYNSTLQRLIRKLNLLDVVDEQSGSGKLDLIVQLPYSAKTPTKQAYAESRRAAIEEQLTTSKFGIAYIDSTEHVTQLNRAVENKLLSQVEYLTNLLYSQLGMTPAVLDGTANEQVMLNYHNRTVEPILSAIVDEMKRKFLTQTARTQGQSIVFFREPFKLVPVEKLADIADKFTRNEILSSNELRQIIGFKPSKQPGADELRNKNLNKSKEELRAPINEDEDPYVERGKKIAGLMHSIK